MEADFWHRRWHKNEIGFHEAQGNHLLKAYFDKLTAVDRARVFVPLCGKTRDIAWLLSQGHNVVGVELNESAVKQLFEELGVDLQVAQLSTSPSSVLKHFHHTFENGLTIDVYQGDYFASTAQLLGNIDVVFDRAALVALPEQMRSKYCAHLIEITHKAEQLLVCFEYQDGLIQGPPHSVSFSEVEAHYKQHYSIELLEHSRIEGGFRDESEVFESAYILRSN